MCKQERRNLLFKNNFHTKWLHTQFSLDILTKQRPLQNSPTCSLCDDQIGLTDLRADTKLIAGNSLYKLRHYFNW